MRAIRRLIAAGLAIGGLAAGCAARVYTPPTGPGASAPEAGTAWAEATSPCREARNANVVLRVAVKQGRWRSTSLSVSAGVTSAGQILLDAGQVFTLAGTSDRADLLLREDRRLVTARAEEIVDAFIGVKIGPERLLAVLTGCVSRVPSRPITSAARYGDVLAVGLADGRAFLVRRDGRWRVMAAEIDDVTITYASFEGYWPAEWRATSGALDAQSRVLEVQMTDLQVNDAALDAHPEAFRLQTPSGAVPMTLADLRAAGLQRPRR